MNIEKFRIEAENKHKVFIERLRSQIDKVFADHVLKIETCSSKIRLISNTLKDLDIITNIYTEDQGDYRVFTLRKGSLNSAVQIYTNGTSIRISCDDIKIGGVMGFSFEKTYNVESEDFDWDVFANDLLDKIHYAIYKQAEANEVKVEGVLNDPERQ